MCCERSFFVAKLKGAYFLYLRLAQGSRNAPLCWARLAALVCRLLQRMFDDDTWRLNCFVDDPCFALRDLEQTRDRMVALIVLVWRSLQLPLAFRKGCLGATVDWIGSRMACSSSGPERNHDQIVSVTIKDEILQDGRQLTERCRTSNVI